MKIKNKPKQGLIISLTGAVLTAVSSLILKGNPTIAYCDGVVAGVIAVSIMVFLKVV